MSLWGRDKIHRSPNTLPHPSWHSYYLASFYSHLFSSAPVRRELLFSTKPETSALGFVPLWCLHQRVFAVFFHGICSIVHLPSIQDNLILICSRQPIPPGQPLYLCPPPPPSSDRFVLPATSCSPWLPAASVHACRKNVLPGAWIVLFKHVQHPV